MLEYLGGSLCCKLSLRQILNYVQKVLLEDGRVSYVVYEADKVISRAYLNSTAHPIALRRLAVHDLPAGVTIFAVLYADGSQQCYRVSYFKCYRYPMLFENPPQPQDWLTKNN